MSVTAKLKEMASKVGAVAHLPLSSSDTGVEPMSDKEKFTATANEFIPKVLEAFDALCQSHPTLVARFKTSFDERAQMPGFPESRRGTEGLAAALAGLLGEIPESLQLGQSSESKLDESFTKQFPLALDEVAKRHPVTLFWMKKHHCNTQVPLSVFLGALLDIYIRDKDMIPY